MLSGTVMRSQNPNDERKITGTGKYNFLEQSNQMQIGGQHEDSDNYSDEDFYSDEFEEEMPNQRERRDTDEDRSDDEFEDSGLGQVVNCY